MFYGKFSTHPVDKQNIQNNKLNIISSTSFFSLKIRRILSRSQTFDAVRLTVWAFFKQTALAQSDTVKIMWKIDHWSHFFVTDCLHIAYFLLLLLEADSWLLTLSKTFLFTRVTFGLLEKILLTEKSGEKMLNFSFLLVGHAFQLEHFLHGSKYVFGDNVGLAQLGLEGQITVAMIDVDALGLGLIRRRRPCRPGRKRIVQDATLVKFWFLHPWPKSPVSINT